ncbi:Eco57I restriction-modification methylase domain-containing protein [Prevotella nanceiensis]|uniref:Eco57I restriction-modification methylase domain-containing protein n=1 Tax=Hoylesella nanceiensis TaxID=425941 RepID=UPI001C5D84E9|nr:DNA methyltransferase [Hoylesella nanceiensis]MBW4766503.1 Eco57I restriction-modification methylase domain-containing protein [Hoylesella nanceiensis]
MKRNIFNQYIAASDFKGLFVSEMLWNNPTGATQLPEITIDNTTFHIEQIAERKGFQILQCKVKQIPSSAICKKIDHKIRKNAENYICIFILPETLHHLWVAPVKKVEKRDVVLIEYDSLDKAAFLFEKMESLSFSLDDNLTILDIIEKVQAAFLINSEKITKDFYAGFKKEHSNFAKFITGIDDHIDEKENKNKQWYASVMLNRLMFCYFIQKKEFLDGDVDYLRHKLEWTRDQEGEDRFFNKFYKGFLVNLFHDGLNTPKHNHEFEKIYGRIPYLNGGMFDVHQIEREYANLDIADEAFISLFDFFDKWHWHLDDRMTASGRDINPDVLGYIFEQYINDRAQMGAYYTKEDITEYIGRNTIVPYLMDAVKRKDEKHFRANSELWLYLKESGDKYIFDAMKKGVDQTIPEEIATGLDTTKPNLLERRCHWNERTPEAFALPTEIWRETIERLQRYNNIKEKITKGEITNINDFITYNLNIRQFVTDYLANTQNHLFIKHFYHALQHVTILDPTCGSGAFLFATLNILEPLYEVCINRMQEFNAKNSQLFKQELQEIEHKYRSNIQYFIYKSIILCNLYGVDIMVEATEIAKLRLFLKMVAVVEVDKRDPNLGLDPLPDIDFNIRCGNTLVGYATQEELERDLVEGDMFAREEFKAKVNDEMDKVSRTYEIFKNVQLHQAEDMATFKNAKSELYQRLNTLNDLLNHKMYGAVDSAKGYNAWYQSHQPFHWLAEFYEIINEHGGFDVIIGNPPYVEYNKKVKGVAVSDLYKLVGYKTLSCGNLYAYVLERSKNIMRQEGYISMIVPLSGHSTERMTPLVTNFYEKFRLVIFTATNNGVGKYSTKYTRWLADERKNLFNALVRYNSIEDYTYQNIIPKIASPLFISIARKIKEEKAQYFVGIGNEQCLYHNAPVNWIRSHTFVPYFCSDRDGEGITTQLKSVSFDNAKQVKVGSCILNSSLFFIWWITNSDCYHLNKPEIVNFKYQYNKGIEKEICSVADRLAIDMKKKCIRRVYNYKTTGRVEYDEFYMKLSKPIIDEIDKILARHYGFTEEELDFIINYDIKYRMGNELNEE